MIETDAEAGDRPQLSIVIPAFNEARRIGGAIESIAKHLHAAPVTFEVLVVDDGSTDGTAEVAHEAGARFGLALEVLRHELNRGKGFAVRRGMLAARGSCALFMDADLAVPIDQADRFLECIRNGADVVIGSRKVAGARIEVHQPWWRERLGILFRNVARWLVVPDVSDFTCGFKMFRREAGQLIFARQRLWGWGFDVEILLIARRAGFQVSEQPVEWRDDPDTKVRLVRDSLRSALDLARIRWHDLRGAYRGDT